MTDPFVVALLISVPCGIAGAIIARRRAMLGFLLGALLGPVGVAAAFRIDGRPRCWTCGGRVEPGTFRMCPHCHEPIEFMAVQAQSAKPWTVPLQMPCSDCGAPLRVILTGQVATCPVCRCRFRAPE